MQSIPRSIRGLVAALACVVGATTVQATMLVVPLTLDEVTSESRRVVHAVVSARTSGRDEHGVPSTWTTFATIETLKGAHARTFTIKEYGVTAPLPDGTLTRIAGLPTYEVGEEVVLFLRAASRRGFTSPVGLGQGSYRVRRERGVPEVRSDDSRGGPRALADFVDHVRARARAEER